MTDLDPVIHAPTRLRIMTQLVAALPQPADEATFTALQRDLQLTAGNLTTHLSKLEDAGYVALSKAFAGRKPVTYIALTDDGRHAFARYRTALMSMLGEE